MYAGRLVKGKGYDVFLRAARRLEDRGCGGNYLVVGEGDCSRDFDRLVNELELTGRIVRFPLLAQNKLAELYRMADVFIFPTMLKESLGLVAIEAMSCGLPVIGSDCAALRYYIQDGVNGYRFPAGDDEALAERMERLTEGNCDMEKLREGALHTAQKYGKENCKAIVRDMLEQISLDG